MNGHAARAGHPRPDRLPPPALDDAPVTEAPCPEDQRCPSTYPDCPQIRCQRHLHRPDIACTATGSNPWRASFWNGGVLP